MSQSNWQESFLEFLKARPTLPGEAAHELVALKGRVKASEINQLQIRPKISAVAVVFERVYSDEYRIVLIKRKEYAGVHSAQISFPGGRRDGDESLIQTSLRELYEEVGIAVDEKQLLTPLTELYIPPSNFLMYPFAYKCDTAVKCYPDPNEVADVVYLPLERLAQEPCFELHSVDVRGFNLRVPAIELSGHIIWGATAMVLAEIHMLIKSFIRNFEKM
ncbi:coenzyme A pyrophosphatase [Thermaurantimonas aggregans]|uniref:Coenzyme A pyrophosphatase n=1 Tax=Thermaurantimonas aggregans TaxID=2173829 RepID=A0A401XM05_9FLAO|nr:CoA pyrophosphatase [Thermaurantimonas aggregans]MCX8148067.1 CoA pyrophosphatase [Thermaurantimonas aggregans]GCD78055.1 coenzyme A pyrophosphatase [Thermaurantimonas aggregans]